MANNDETSPTEFKKWRRSWVWSLSYNFFDWEIKNINEQNNFQIIDNLHLKDREYDEKNIIKKLQNKGLQPEPLIKDKIPQRDLFDRLLNKNKWYPC